MLLRIVCKYCTMSCTSIPNAHFIFYCTKQSRSVPMSWFLFRTRLRTAACIGEIRIQPKAFIWQTVRRAVWFGLWKGTGMRIWVLHSNSHFTSVECSFVSVGGVRRWKNRMNFTCRTCSLQRDVGKPRSAPTGNCSGSSATAEFRGKNPPAAMLTGWQLNRK